MINWGRNMPVVAQARSTGNTFSGSFWTAVEWMPTLYTKRHHRGPSGRSVTPTWISLLNLDVPWLGTLPLGRECVYENPWHLCLLRTTVLTMCFFVWMENAAGAKDAMRWISAKKLWLGVLPVTFTSVRTATSQGTELKTNRNQMSKCDWFRECDKIVIVIVISYFYL